MYGIRSKRNFFIKKADLNSRYYIAPLLGLTTGMRIGEILGLRWKDVNLEEGLVRVIQTLSSDGKTLMPYTKSAAGKRAIKLSPETLSYLELHKQRIDKEKIAQSYKNYDLVVCTEYGNPSHKSNIRRYFNVQIKKLGLPQIRFHDTRHTHATLLLEQGVNPKIVSKRLGHADVRITLDRYSHLLPSMQDEVAINFGKMLFGEEEEEERIKVTLR